MSVRPPLSFLASIVAVAAVPAFGQATTFTLTDFCGSTVTGSPAGNSIVAQTVDSAGNAMVPAFVSSSFVVAPGNCPPLPADGKPVCTLSASQHKVPRGGAVTLVSKCTNNPPPSPGLTYTWLGPQAGPDLPDPDSNSSSLNLTFNTPGAYTYTVSAKAAGVPGKPSAPLTILVGDTTDKPTCALTISPSLVTIHDTATVQVSCQPEPTSLTWDTPTPTGAATPPASPNTFGDLTFDVPGIFTYAVAGVNAAGAGPKSGALVTVATSIVFKNHAEKTAGGTLAYPAGVVAGDFLVLFTVAPTSTNPTAGLTSQGWTSVRSLNLGSAAYNASIFTKVAGSETTTALGTGSQISGWLLVFSGVNGGAGVIGTFTETTATATSCIKSLTGLTPGSTIVGFASDREGTFPTTPTGYTMRSQTAGGVWRSTLATREYTTTSTGNVVFPTGNVTAGICNLIELKP
jgi:hypothetical protein